MARCSQSVSKHIKKANGWGGWIRTSGGDTKNRCLTTWLRPNQSGP